MENALPITCGYCKDCIHRDKYGDCTNDEKITDLTPDKNIESALIYSYAEDGTFQVVPHFGCVHFTQKL